MTTSTSLPTGVSATMRGKSFISLMSLPSNLTTTSPGSMPAGLAGPRSSTPAISAPRAGLMARLSASILGHLLNAHAEPAAPRLAELAQLIDHRNGGLRRHGKADADRAARRRIDRGIDADHLAVEVEQRSARIAAIDRRVSLDVVVIRAGIDVAIARRDDAGRNRAAEAEWVADGDHPFAEPQLVGIPELHGFQRPVGLDPQQREIGLLILANDLSLELSAIREDDIDLVGVRNDVIVGHHDARRVDDEAGAERTHAARPAFAALLARSAATVLEQVVEKLLKGGAGRHLRRGRAAHLDRLRGRDVDDRFDHAFGNVGDLVRSARRARRRNHGQTDDCSRECRQCRPAQARGSNQGIRAWMSVLLRKGYRRDTAPVRRRMQGDLGGN